MFQAFSETLFGAPGASKSSSNKENNKLASDSMYVNGHVNMSRNSKVSKDKLKKAPSAPYSADLESTKIENLQNDLLVKDSMIQALTNRIAQMEDAIHNETITAVDKPTGNRQQSIGGGIVNQRRHVMPTEQHIVGNEGVINKKLGTRESMLTNKILDSIEKAEKTPGQIIAEKFKDVCQHSSEHVQYLNSSQFAKDLMTVCAEIETVLEQEPRVIFLQSPCYVFGDIHGNLEDLQFFAENIWKMGMNLTAGKFLFLGDYVDRGMFSLECTAYLFAMKLLYPHKIYLLRGNHETRDVNGWEDHYAEKSFVRQCKDRFGMHIGTQVWEECNQAFDRLALAAVIDQDIFCIHGGIPRPIDDFTNEIQAIMAVPKVAAVMPSYEHETEWQKQVAGDCIWSDPAADETYVHLGPDGFGESPRGGGAICFGAKAIDNFLATNNLSYIIRAHEAHANGVSLSKGGRVFTVFSTSKDHRQGSNAMAGCILVDNYMIQVINRSPKYKNKFTHRRSSYGESAK
jgi:diadenosine tetraphosphatase ApaH/serine/threonine PP2A family protein phosphatase